MNILSEVVDYEDSDEEYFLDGTWSPTSNYFITFE